MHLPALIRPRPRLERLLDRPTLPSREVPGRLPLPRAIGGVLGGRGGRVPAYRHPLPAPPGGFPLDTGRREAWVSQLGSLHPNRDVTFWDVISFQRIVERWPHDWVGVHKGPSRFVEAVERP